ncbi:MAG: MFS transporter [Tistlia sp.]|uniref:MFS transporter n=1 Tax=Tistlia sp. TaxID=3057121 RepID=UPI0034A231BE
MTLPRSAVVLVLGTAQTLGWGSTFYLPAILAEPMAADLGIPVDGVFAAFSGALLVGVLLGPLAGGRIDSRGGRGLLSLSSLIFAAGLALLGLAQEPAVMVAAWLIIGVGMTIGLYEAAFSALASLYGARARGAITGITLIAGFASTICWPVSAALEAEVGWRGACFAWAAAHLLIGLPLNRLLPRGVGRPPVPAAGLAPEPAPPPAERPPIDRTMLLLGFFFATVWFTTAAIGTHLPRLLQQAGASPAAAIAAAALVGPAQVAGRLLEFGLLQRLHPLFSARAASLAHPLGAAVLILLGAPGAVAFSLLHGAGAGVLTIAKGTLPLALFGPHGYGVRQGLLMVPTRLAQASAPFLFALLMARFGTDALAITAGIGLAGLAALLLLHPAAAKPT